MSDAVVVSGQARAYQGRIGVANCNFCAPIRLANHLWTAR